MAYKTEMIKEGIKLHSINTSKFKTNLISVFFSVPLKRETVTPNALIPAVLRRGTKSFKSQEVISKKLEEMYGATFDCGIEKKGDYQILKFYLEMINDEYLPKTEDIFEDGVNLLLDIIFNPLIENCGFNSDYVKTEKENLKKIIQAKIDNKDRYAYERCIEEMYKNKTYGLDKFGYIEDLEKIDSQNLYNSYIDLINTAKIDMFVSGSVDFKKISNYLKQNDSIIKLKERKDLHVICQNDSSNTKLEPKNIEEKLDVTQGKLVIGTDVAFDEEDAKYKISLYNVILGEGATSKLFQNVREKEGLAYTTRSNYIRQKGNIFIRCGIEIANYQKTVDIIKKQLQDMKDGKFTKEDIQNAKKYIVSSIKNVTEEQDTEISYYFGQEMEDGFTTLEQYEEKINSVTPEDIQNVANNVIINTVYFLRN